MNFLRAKSLIAVIAFVFVLSLGSLFAADETINGAGASFPNPLYQKWALKYYKMNSIKVNYQSIGSGGGIKQIKAKTVNFGASDKPLKAEELNESGLIQFPMVMGGIVPVVNIKGIKAGDIKLNADTLVKIFSGKITNWKAPEIAKLNPGLKLPDKAISVVHRSDGSGSTWLLTNYFSKVSEDWKKNFGNDKVVEWPKGNFYGGKGNEGVASYVERLNGSIGYVEFAYAVQNKLSYISLQNKDGKYVIPSFEAFQAAAAGADWKNAPGFYVVLTDQAGAKSWPITGATFILIYKDQVNAQTAKTMLNYFNWCFENGDKMAEELHYVPMPKPVVEIVKEVWAKEVKTKGNAIWK
ncbi:MAG: phosphate ABC transporter substrate-binding protein PstS [Acidobacteria bacterium]|nr:phosphate ABC transporter substrate-binding protein PstS [Acidobacteriota bacterium]